MPALLNSKSSRPKASFARANSAFTASGLPTSAGTASTWPPPACAIPAVRSNSATRRPASTTEYPAPCNATLTARPIPLPAPVTSAILLSPMFRPLPVRRRLLHCQQKKEDEIVSRMHHRGSFGRSGVMAHPTEGHPCRRNQQRMPPGVAVLRIMHQPERRCRQQNAGRRSQRTNQQRLQKSAKYDFFEHGRQRGGEHRHHDNGRRVREQRLHRAVVVGSPNQHAGYHHGERRHHAACSHKRGAHGRRRPAQRLPERPAVVAPKNEGQRAEQECVKQNL